MSKNVNNTSEEVRASVASIYSELLSKRKQEKEAKEEQKRIERELRQQEKEEKKYNEDGTKLSKKERREAEFDNWKEIIVGLTSDDLEYSSSPKKNKKKYKKWIDDEQDTPILTAKPKKNKKKNYNKEFAPELQMLKTIVADQNKFTADLQKRFNIMAGPATKDAMPPNKTMVELASAINAGRSNSLGVLKEIGNLKKVIAELYIKQRKEELDKGAGSLSNMDLGLMGSNIASSIFSDDLMAPISPVQTVPGNTSPTYINEVPINNSPMVVQGTTQVVNNNQTVTTSNIPQFQEFDPSTWDPDGINVNPSVQYESIPHHIVVEMNKATNDLRFKAIHDETGEELPECPVPTYDTRNLKINEKDLIAKGQFDETYKLQVI